MNAGVCTIHSTNCSLSKCILFLYGCAIHTLPFLWDIAFLTCITMQFHCIPQMICVMFHLHLQYMPSASVLQAGNIFQAINWLYVLYRPLLGSKCDKTHIHNTEYEATAHFMHVIKLLSASCTIITWQCIIYYSVSFPPWKEQSLLEKCNYLWSEICHVWDFTQHGMVILNTIVLLGPWRPDQKIVPEHWQLTSNTCCVT